MVGTIGTTQKDIYESAHKRAYNNFIDKPSDELRAIMSTHEGFDEYLRNMRSFKRRLVNFVLYLFEGSCRPGKGSPKYKAAQEILEKRVSIF